MPRSAISWLKLSQCHGAQNATMPTVPPCPCHQALGKVLPSLSIPTGCNSSRQHLHVGGREEANHPLQLLFLPARLQSCCSVRRDEGRSGVMGTSQPTPCLRSDLQQLLAPTQHQQRLGLRPTGSKNSLSGAACPICAVTGDAVTLVITCTGNQSQDWWLKGVVPHHGSAEGTLRSPNCSPKAKAICLQVLATSTGGFSHFPLVFSSLSSTTKRFQLLA